MTKLEPFSWEISVLLLITGFEILTHTVDLMDRLVPGGGEVWQRR